MTHWHAASWLETPDTRNRKYRGSEHVAPEGAHGALIERNGAYAFHIDVPGDPRTWVVRWACDRLSHD
jgi:hypothetical protein